MKRRTALAVAASAAILAVTTPTVVHDLTEPSAEESRCVVTKVSDGDTFWCQAEGSQPEKVRLIGVDTPETHKPGTPVQCFGPEAEAFAHTTLMGQRVRLEKDKRDKDRYGRLLRYVWLDGMERDTAGMFNAILIIDGFARADPVRPDVKYRDIFASLESEAKARGVGRWGSCPLP